MNQIPNQSSAPARARRFSPLEERRTPRVGFVVDHTIMSSLPDDFTRMTLTSGLNIAEGETRDEVGVVFVERPPTSAVLAGDHGADVIEALRSADIHQVICMIHHVLDDTHGSPAARDTGKAPKEHEILTIGVQWSSVCNRLQNALMNAARSTRDIHGVFNYLETDDFPPALLVETRYAHRHGICIAASQATTVRVEPQSTRSESTLLQVLTDVPAKLSPLGSCQCAQLRIR